MNDHNSNVITSLMRLPTPKIGLRASNKSVSREICGHVSHSNYVNGSDATASDYSFAVSAYQLWL